MSIQRVVIGTFVHLTRLTRTKALFAKLWLVSREGELLRLSSNAYPPFLLLADRYNATGNYERKTWSAINITRLRVICAAFKLS